MTQAVFLGIDLGASALKACAINAQGRVLTVADVPVRTHHPYPQHCEQNPTDWVKALRACVPQLWRTRVQGAHVEAISVTAGAHTAVLTDISGKPVAPAILWSDMRAHADAAALQRHAARFIQHNGNRPNATWTAAHLRWHARQATAQRAQRLYLAKDWLRAQLSESDDWHTDIADAIGTLLAQRQHGQWCSPLVRLARWSGKKLPPIVPALQEVARASKRTSTALGIRPGTPIICGSNDTSVELLCANACQNGAATIKLASAGVVSLCDAAARPHPPISLYPHVIAPLQYHAAGMNNCTTALDWACKALGVSSIAALERLARGASPGSGGVCFYPYLNGERAPLWSPDWRAAWLGVSTQTTQQELARAVYEGIGFALYEIWQDMRARTRHKPHRLSILGGGARSAFWVQMLADIFGHNLHVPAYRSAAYGAALLAATAGGAYRNLAAAARATTNTTQLVRARAQMHTLYQSRFKDFLAWRAGAPSALKAKNGK